MRWFHHTTSTRGRPPVAGRPGVWVLTADARVLSVHRTVESGLYAILSDADMAGETLGGGPTWPQWEQETGATGHGTVMVGRLEYALDWFALADNRW